MVLSEERFRDLGFDREIVIQLAESGLSNYTAFGKKGLTGPLLRGDEKTLISHLDAIDKKDEEDLYRKLWDFFKDFMADSDPKKGNT